MSQTEIEDRKPRDYEIDELVQAYVEADATAQEAADELAKRKEALLTAILLRDEGSLYGYTLENEILKVTAVTPERAKTDEAALRLLIGGRAFNKLTVRRLDKAKVEKAILDGDLSIEAYAAVTEIKATKPYVLISRVDR